MSLRYLFQDYKQVEKLFGEKHLASEESKKFVRVGAEWPFIIRWRKISGQALMGVVSAEFVVFG